MSCTAPRSRCRGSAWIFGAGTAATPVIRFRWRRWWSGVRPRWIGSWRFSRGAVAVRAPGGTLFLAVAGNRPPRAAFRPAIRRAHPTPATDTAEIRQRVHRALLSEPELLLAPEFFTTWAAEHPSVAGLDIEVKRGVADNELNRYRYDVIVHKTPTPVRSLPAPAATRTCTQSAALPALHTPV